MPNDGPPGSASHSETTAESGTACATSSTASVSSSFAATSGSLPSAGPCAAEVSAVYDVRRQRVSSGRPNTARRKVDAEPAGGAYGTTDRAATTSTDSPPSLPAASARKACSASSSDGTGTLAGGTPDGSSCSSSRCSGAVGVLKLPAHQSTSWPCARVSAT